MLFGESLVDDRSIPQVGELATGRFEPASGASQRPLGLEQLGRHPIGRLSVQFACQRVDADTHLVESGCDRREFGFGEWHGPDSAVLPARRA